MDGTLLKLLSNYKRCRILDEGRHHIFLYYNPTLPNRLIANEIYEDSLRELRFDSDVLDKSSSLAYLINYGFWSIEQEKRVDQLAKEIRLTKQELCRNFAQVRIRQSIKANLSQAKSEYSSLLYKRHKYDHLTKEGIALSSRTRYLVGSSLYREDGSPYWVSNGLYQPDHLFDNVVTSIFQPIFGETEIRSVARK